MKYLFNYSDFLYKKIKLHSKIYLFLDFDGTLTPIVRNPEKSALSAGMKKVLIELSKNSNIKLVIVSGRSIKNLKQKIKVKNISLAGNHGFEFEMPGIKHIHPAARKSGFLMKAIKRKLDAGCKSIQGVIIENKGFTMSVHYRQVDGNYVGRLRKIISDILMPYVKTKKIKLTKGKKVIEIRPPVLWDKGTLVNYILEREKLRLRARFLPICVGDDRTDEAMFEKLKNKGITVFVGNKSKNSAAEFYVDNIQQVRQFLISINKIKKN